ncbi:MAG: AMP-binding protein [Pseudomonadota bacterium]
MRRIHDLIMGQPASNLALIDHDDRPISYEELRRDVASLGRILAECGLRPGDRAVLVCENSALYATLVMAASEGDFWLTLVNARQSADELAAIVAHAAPRTVLFTPHVSEAAAAHAARLGAAEVGRLGDAPLWATPAVQSTPEPVLEDGDQVAVLLYTTGTTSAPKGVMLTHKNLIFAASRGADYFSVRPQDRVLGVLPGTHIYALSSVFLNAMAAGAALRLRPRFDVARTIADLRDGITRFPGVPQMFAAIMADLARSGEPLAAPALRALLTGGAPLDPGLKTRVEDCFGLPLSNGYGMTETAPSIASTHPDAPRDDVSVGPPYPWIEVRIAAPDTDGVGEVQVRGPNVMRGYYKAPDKTAEAMTDDGFFRTGDLGRMGEDGALFIVGRLKELIIRSGFNVHPPEIEAMLSRHDDVIMAAVVGRPVPGNEEIVAFVRNHGAATGADLRDWLRDRLVAYKVPQHVLCVDDWPAAATGKPLKHKLLAHFADRLPPED